MRLRISSLAVLCLGQSLLLYPFSSAASLESKANGLCTDKNFRSQIYAKLELKNHKELVETLYHLHLRLGFGPSIRDDRSFPPSIDKANLTKTEFQNRIASLVCESLHQQSELPAEAKALLAEEFPELSSKSEAELYRERFRLRHLKTSTPGKPGRNADFQAFAEKNYHYFIAERLLDGFAAKGISFQSKLNNFWGNHFSVDSGSIGDSNLLSSYFRQIRSKQNGTFKELLEAAILHPAMQRYLNNDENRAPQFNLNLARELLELYGIGARPSEKIYTQKDIENVAKLISGLSINSSHPKKLAIKIERETLSESDRRALGKTFAPGLKGISELMEHIAKHSTTKDRICRKLGRFFLNLEPSPKDLQRCKNVWGVNGNLSMIYKEFLLSEDFWSQKNYANGIRLPFEMSVSSLRLSDHKNFSAYLQASVRYLHSAGQKIGAFSTPNGYRTNPEFWGSQSALHQWIDFREKIKTGKLLVLDKKLVGTRIDYNSAAFWMK